VIENFKVLFMSTSLEHAGTGDETARTQSHAHDAALRLISINDYYRMGEAGIFDEDGQVELFEGRIYKLSPKSPLHSATVGVAAKHLTERVAGKCLVRQQSLFVSVNNSEPEPDLSLVKLRGDEYSKAHPTPEDCLLLAEVSLSTLNHDRERKGAAYAAAGIMQYVILNLSTRELEDRREPSPEGYRLTRVLRADERFNLVAFPEIEITVGDLLPPE
jgi:Uma2 family endonuclease